MKHSTKPKGQEYWENMVSQWKASGLSANRFSILHGINQSNFNKWKNRLVKETGSKDFLITIPLKFPPMNNDFNNFSDTALTLVFKDFQLQLGDNFPETTLKKLLSVIREVNHVS